MADMKIALIFLFVFLTFSAGSALGSVADTRGSGGSGARGQSASEAQPRAGGFLEGRITEAKADALPDITWNTIALRSRDPWFAEQPEFRSLSA